MQRICILAIGVALVSPILVQVAGAEREEHSFALHEALLDREYAEAVRLIPLTHDLDAPDSSGRTPLTIAASMEADDAFDMVLALLKMGADPGLQDAKGYTPLHHAARAGTLSVVHLLVDKFGVDLESSIESASGELITPMRLAMEYDKPRVVNFLESSGASLPRDFQAAAEIQAAIRNQLDELSGEQMTTEEKIERAVNYDPNDQNRHIDRWTAVRQGALEAGGAPHLVEMCNSIIKRISQWTPEEHPGVALSEYAKQVASEESNIAVAKAQRGNRQ